MLDLSCPNYLYLGASCPCPKRFDESVSQVCCKAQPSRKSTWNFHKHYCFKVCKSALGCGELYRISFLLMHDLHKGASLQDYIFSICVGLVLGTVVGNTVCVAYVGNMKVTGRKYADDAILFRTFQSPVLHLALWVLDMDIKEHSKEADFCLK